MHKSLTKITFIERFRESYISKILSQGKNTALNMIMYKVIWASYSQFTFPIYHNST